jgi:transcriptional regulator with XRE-family HTH domain
MGRKQGKLIDQIRRAARDCGMGQNALGRKVKIDKGTLSRFVRGKVGLSMESLDALADVLNLRVVAGKPIKLPPPLKPGRKPRKTR